MARVMHRGYSATQIGLHWLIAGLVILNWFLGEPMSEIFDRVVEGEGEGADVGFPIHVLIGMAILVLTAIRFFVKLNRPVETAPNSSNGLLVTVAKVTHWLFYILLIAVPVGGAIAWFGGIEDVGEMHGLAANLLMLLVVIHAGAALMHQFVLRDGTLTRMTRPSTD